MFNGGGGKDTLIVEDLTGTDITVTQIFFNALGDNDILDASATDRRIIASGGEDDDALTGGPGDDFIRGGKGQDQLTGGANSDTFARLSPDELIFHGAKSVRLASETGDELLDFNSIADTLEFEAKPFGFPNSCTPQDGVNFYTLSAQGFDGSNSNHQTSDPYFVFSTFQGENVLYYDDTTALDGYYVVAQVVGPNSDQISAGDVGVFLSIA
jgi:Ca2+-binding RTX toxin-like protein